MPGKVLKVAREWPYLAAAMRRFTSLRTMLAYSGGLMASSSERTHSDHLPLRLDRSPNRRAASPLALPRLLCQRSNRRDFSSSRAARSARDLLARLKLIGKSCGVNRGISYTVDGNILPRILARARAIAENLQLSPTQST